MECTFVYNLAIQLAIITKYVKQISPKTIKTDNKRAHEFYYKNCFFIMKIWPRKIISQE